MKPSRTTAAGVAAGTFLAAAQIPNLNPSVELTLKLAAAVAIAALGRNAKDCPANCPGTDAQGRPHPWQGLFFMPLVAMIFFVVALALMSGCVSRNPQAGPSSPAQPAFIVSPQLAETSNTVSQLAQVAGQATGTGPLIPTATNGAFLLVAALSALWAKHKNEVAASMAAGIAKAGPEAVSTVLRSASDGPKYAAVATAINEQLSAGQAPGQPAPAKP